MALRTPQPVLLSLAYARALRLQAVTPCGRRHHPDANPGNHRAHPVPHRLPGRFSRCKNSRILSYTPPPCCATPLCPAACSDSRPARGAEIQPTPLPGGLPFEDIAAPAKTPPPSNPSPSVSHAEASRNVSTAALGSVSDKAVAASLARGRAYPLRSRGR